MSTSPSLWTFALRTYGAPGCAEACLELQSTHGVDVPVLLFAAWLAVVRSVELSAGDLDRVVAQVDPWHREVVRPLRAVRQSLKAGPAPAPSPATEALRAKVKAAELEAERIELATLEEIGLGLSAQAHGMGAEDLATANLDRVVRYYGAASDTDAVSTVVTAALGPGLIGTEIG